MGETVQAIIARHRGELRPGDALPLNSPYHGGTHLPDITVVTPVFLEVRRPEGADAAGPLFFVASRGHHADVGGITPGSMPPEAAPSTRRACSSRTSASSGDGRLREAE